MGRVQQRGRCEHRAAGEVGASLQAGRWALCVGGHVALSGSPQSGVLPDPSHVVGFHIQVCLQDWF